MSEPLNLMDLRRKEIVHKLNGGEQTLIIKGLTAKDYYGILNRFERIAALALGGRASIFDALKETPDALAAWVAAACGYGGNAEAEQAALDNLTVEEAMAIAQATMPLTFTKGFGPFFDLQTDVLGMLIPINLGKVSDTASPSPSTPVEDSSIPAFGS
jgi:hypothetical protein